MNKVFLTGCAGFIGHKTTELLLNNGYEVLGVDNMNDYYDVRIKEWRLNKIKENSNFIFKNIDIENYDELNKIFLAYKFDAIINLAARAGVRYSMENPYVYITTNAIGTLNLLEIMKEKKIGKIVLASTSSLYAGQEMPFNEKLAVNTPISQYAASKKAAEVMCYTYHYLYKL